MRPPPLRRYFEGLLLLLLATGLATLAVTGELGWPVLGIAGAAFAWRGLLFWRRREVRVAPRWMAAGLMAYLPVFFLDGLFLSHSFIAATLHLVVLAEAAQLFCAQSGRDYATLGLLALLEVLAAALLTVSGAFFLLFILFLALLITTLVAHEMMQAQAEAEAARPLSNWVAPAGRSVAGLRSPAGDARAAHAFSELPLPEAAGAKAWITAEGSWMGAAATPGILRPLLRFSLLLSGAVAGLSVLIFFLLPRLNLGVWPSRPLTGLSGFSDDVRLGSIADLQRSDQPVMHVRMTSSNPVLTANAFQQIPWRGRGLTHFDGRRWSSPEDPALFRTEDGRLQVDRPDPDEAAEIVRYQVTLDPIGSPVLFFPARLLRTATHYPVLAWERSTATLSSLGPGFAGTSYSGISDVAQPPAGELRQSPAPMSWRLREALAPFLQLPESLDPRIGELARQVTGHAPRDNWDRMQALTQYLQTHYQYSLQDLPAGADPLSTFLFDRQSGDCEYFASALAVLARTLDIPTRVVNGFVLGSYNPISGEYLVRGQDAHSWVEAYFPAARPFGRGHWVSFDATPAAAVNAGIWPEAGMVMDALSSFWQEWIVNYDWLRQANLARTLQHSFSRAPDVSAMVEQARERVWRSRTGPRGGEAAAALGFAGLALLALAWRRGWRWQWWRPRRRSRGDETSARARRAYRRFQRYLSRLGLLHYPAQTSQELLTLVKTAHPGTVLAEAATAFVASYDALRFGPAHAALAPQLERELERVRRACKPRAAK